MPVDVRGVHALPRRSQSAVRRGSVEEETRISKSRARPFRMYRLDSSDYRAVFDDRRPLFGRTLSMWVRCTTDAGRRAGVVVSKKNFRRAVDRNRTKRLMREAFRLNRRNLAENADIILSARRDMAGKKLEDVNRDFVNLCRRAGIWRG